MNRSRIFLGFLSLSVLMGGAAGAADEGYPYVGTNLGVSVPTNKNYEAHSLTGAAVNPYAGYMFNKYIGAQGEVLFTFQPPDNDHRGFEKESQTATLFGGTIGPRLSVPIGDYVDVYTTAQGGFFTGLSGTLNHSGPGFGVGGGVNFNPMPELSVGLFGRWNRVYFSPRPDFLGGAVPQEPSAQGPADLRFVTTGIDLQYNFMPPPPPPPPVVAQKPPPPPPPPVKKKIVLRSVHFDFNKSNIRSDAVPVLNEAVNVLKDEKTQAVIVAGYTDSIGSEAYNMKLSQRRADAVRGYLIEHGIPANRITVEAFGKKNPVASNDTADGRAQNRRVELNLK